jgi:hypothetical protein
MESGPAARVHCVTIRCDFDEVLDDLRLALDTRKVQHSRLAVGLRVDKPVGGLS